MAVKLTIFPPREKSPQVVEFTEDHVTVGRSSRCDIRLPFRVVSGHHLTIHCDSRSGFQIRDEASTNGTLLDGEPLPSGEDHRLQSGTELEIVDLRIEVELVPTLGAGFPLDKTGTMVRQMVGEALLAGTEDDESERAYFEVLRGASQGARSELPDDLERGIISAAPDADIRVEGLETSVEIFRDGDGFGVRLADGAEPALPVTLEGQPLDGGRRLNTGDILSVGSTELEFVDPLETYLAELEGLVPADGAGTATDASNDGGQPIGEGESDNSPLASAGSATAPPPSMLEETETVDGQQSPSSAAQKPSGASWGLLEVGVLFVSLVLLVGVGYLLSTIFGLI